MLLLCALPPLRSGHISSFLQLPSAGSGPVFTLCTGSVEILLHTLSPGAKGIVVPWIFGQLLRWWSIIQTTMTKAVECSLSEHTKPLEAAALLQNRFLFSLFRMKEKELGSLENEK